MGQKEINVSKSFKYQDQYNEYTLQLKRRNWWWLLLLLLLLLFVRCNRDIDIETVNEAGEPLSGSIVDFQYTEHQLFKNGTFFYNKQHHEQGVTDDTGHVMFQKQPCSVFSWIFYTFAMAKAEAENGVKHAQGSFLFHWQLDTYTLVMQNDDAKIQVIDARTLKPIPRATVRIQGDFLPKDSITLITDDDGYCSFQYSDSSDEIKRMVATAPAHSGALYNDVPLKKFEKNVFVIPLDPPMTCDTEVNNNRGDQGKHAVYEFEMGQAGGAFKFDYYTDSAPDHIMVYDGSSAEYAAGTANKIFDYDGATNTTKYTPMYSEVLKFTGTTICVVVDKGTNWGYYVHCP